MAHTRGLGRGRGQARLARSTRIQVAVALQDEARVTMPQLLCDDMRRSAGGDDQRCVRVSLIMEREPIEFRTSNGWPESASHEVVLEPHSARG
jgi:hypothetical protein